MKQEKSTKSIKTNTHNFLVHRFSSICHINRYNRYRSKISIILIDIGYLSYRLYSIARNFPFSQSCVFSPRGHYKNVLWSVDKNVENTDKTWLDFTRLSVIEVILSDVELIDTSRITNYVKGFTHISFARFAYRREELLSIRTRILWNSRFEESIIVLVR